MWNLLEHHDIAKIVRRMPPWIVKEYEIWKSLIYRHGPEILRQFPGYHDELLKGQRKGERSSRLSQKYRVIYTVNRKLITVYVLEVTPHNY